MALQHPSHAVRTHPKNSCHTLTPPPPPPFPHTAGYAVLHYRGAPKALPTAPTPQPGAVAPWTPQQYAELVVDPRLLGNKNKSAAGGVYRVAMSRVGWGLLGCRGVLVRVDACRSTGRGEGGAREV
jgi:hypothetical protein